MKVDSLLLKVVVVWRVILKERYDINIIIITIVYSNWLRSVHNE